MNTKENSVDMLHGPLSKKIILFAMPIALSSILQQLFNAADTSVVGKFCDSNAIAAVGTNGEIVALLVTIALGLASGANVLIATFIGRGEKKKIADAVHTSILMAVILGIVLAIAGQFLARPLLIAIKTPDNVLYQAILYLKIYCAGLPFLLLYDFASCIMRSKGDSRRPFIALVLSGILNIFLNLFFVLVCRMDVAGVSLTTIISTLFSAILLLVWLSREQDEFSFSIKKLCLNKRYCSAILKVGIPTGIQGAVFCVVNLFIQGAVNSFGSVVTAGNTIAMNYEYFAYYMITAFAQAATTFTSQNFGAYNMDRCKKVLRLCLLWGFIFSNLIIVPITIFRDQVSMLFTSEAEVIQVASLRCMIIVSLTSICTFFEVPAGSLRGSGHQIVPTILTIFGTCVLRIIWIFTIFQKYRSLEVLFVSFRLTQSFIALSFLAAFLAIKPFVK